MIAGFGNLQSFNDGKAKAVSVVCVEDASGGMETLTFVIVDQTKTVSVNFSSNQMQTVRVAHTASSNGVPALVQVSAANSPQTLTALLNVDKIPGDS
jgi:hypothetical protein